LAQKQETQATQERKTVTLNGKDYYVDSFKDELQVALVQIEQIQAEQELAKMNLRNLEYAQQFLVDYLSKNVDKLEEVPEQEKEAGE
jgi:regulator of sigma D